MQTPKLLDEQEAESFHFRVTAEIDDRLSGRTTTFVVPRPVND